MSAPQISYMPIGISQILILLCEMSSITWIHVNCQISTVSNPTSLNHPLQHAINPTERNLGAAENKLDIILQHNDFVKKAKSSRLSSVKFSAPEKREVARRLANLESRLARRKRFIALEEANANFPADYLQEKVLVGPPVDYNDDLPADNWSSDFSDLRDNFGYQKRFIDSYLIADLKDDNVFDYAKFLKSDRKPAKRMLMMTDPYLMSDSLENFDGGNGGNLKRSRVKRSIAVYNSPLKYMENGRIVSLPIVVAGRQDSLHVPEILDSFRTEIIPQNEATPAVVIGKRRYGMDPMMNAKLLRYYGIRTQRGGRRKRMLMLDPYLMSSLLPNKSEYQRKRQSLPELNQAYNIGWRKRQDLTSVTTGMTNHDGAHPPPSQFYLAKRGSWMGPEMDRKLLRYYAYNGKRSRRGKRMFDQYLMSSSSESDQPWKIKRELGSGRREGGLIKRMFITPEAANRLIEFNDSAG